MWALGAEARGHLFAASCGGLDPQKATVKLELFGRGLCRCRNVSQGLFCRFKTLGHVVLEGFRTAIDGFVRKLNEFFGFLGKLLNRFFDQRLHLFLDRGGFLKNTFVESFQCLKAFQRGILVRPIEV